MRAALSKAVSRISPWGLARVHGDSMLPTLRPGDLLVVRHGSAGSRVRAGSLVIGRFIDGTIAVKRATESRRTVTGSLGWWLLSDNPESGVDSRHRGPVPDDAILATVHGRLWPRPARL
ncbi:MAG: S24 family peptidase [Nocardioides sp.]